MDQRADSNIILIGFSTTGKSEVGQEVARRLGWRFVDTDEEIVRSAAKSIPEIFEQDGEESFRILERESLIYACKHPNTVIAAGGGATLRPENQCLMREKGMVVCLEAKAETILKRLQQDIELHGPLRPLLNVAEPLERIRLLNESRQPYYAVADWTIHTDNLTPPEVSQEVIRGWYYWRRNRSADEPATPMVFTTSRNYPILIEWGLLDRAGEEISRAGVTGNLYLVSDDIVFPLHGARLEASLRRSGFNVFSFVVPSGEPTKTLSNAISIYEWLVKNHAEREDTIVALGGGMVGDLAGFVASTFLRGLSLVQIPTTLVAMADASIGGKTAVNLPQAKNLIGSFYQPHLVIADVSTLVTLPLREQVSGWAETIKHSLILNADLFEFLERNTTALLNLDTELTVLALKRSADIKAQIVSEDEREQQGRRTLLNYGHTIAHGLEAAMGYEYFLHGEAVAIGMTGAARLSHELGILSAREVQRQEELLKRFGLPISCSGVNLADILRAMRLDKKSRGGVVHWVLLQRIGHAVIRGDIPQETILEILTPLALPLE